MFLTLVVILTVGQMYFEFKIAQALHMEEISRRFILVNLAFSICISLLFGWLFPAAGMTVAAAGLLSTILSQPMYNFVAWWKSHAAPSLKNFNSWYATKKETIHQYAKDLVTVFGAIIVIITLPVRIVRYVANGIRKVQGVLPHG